MTTRSDWLVAHPPAPERLSQTLAGVARRLRGGDDLGALAEHLAAVHGLDRPAWSVEPDRFLDRFWFVSEVPGFRAIAIAQTPRPASSSGAASSPRSRERTFGDRLDPAARFFVEQIFSAG
jgi:hypothetical protein